jgi:DNA-directed RNA polymerase subunit RPC12/RpoP
MKTYTCGICGDEFEAGNNAKYCRKWECKLAGRRILNKKRKYDEGGNYIHVHERIIDAKCPDCKKYFKGIQEYQFCKECKDKHVKNGTDQLTGNEIYF